MGAHKRSPEKLRPSGEAPGPSTNSSEPWRLRMQRSRGVQEGPQDGHRQDWAEASLVGGMAGQKSHRGHIKGSDRTIGPTANRQVEVEASVEAPEAGRRLLRAWLRAGGDRREAENPAETGKLCGWQTCPVFAMTSDLCCSRGEQSRQDTHAQPGWAPGSHSPAWVAGPTQPASQGQWRTHRRVLSGESCSPGPAALLPLVSPADTR